MPKFTNISNGPRGGYLKGKLVEVQPGAEAELDDAPEEWFAKAEKDGTIAPQRKLANEKPKGETVDYDTLIKSWPATPPKRAEAK